MGYFLHANGFCTRYGSVERYRERNLPNGIRRCSQHQQKKLFLRTDRARIRTNSVHSLCPVLRDLPCLLCLSSLASGAPGRPTFPLQRPTRLLRPHPLLVPPPCIRSLNLSSTGLLPTPCGCARPAAISATLPFLATWICRLLSASVHCHPTSLFS